jgi:hypothetical protein
MFDLRSFAKRAALLVMVALRSFALTMLAMLVLGVALAVIAYFVLAEVDPLYGVVAALLALLECAAVGVYVAGKRALVVALVTGVRGLRLGRFGVRLLFERLLGVAEPGAGDRGGVVARVAARLPLAQAEARLERAVRDVLAAQPSGGGISGWVRRRLQAGLLAAVQKYTLARFRAEDKDQGGVDLVKVRADLEERIDALLAAKLMRGVNGLLPMVLVGLSVQVLGLVWLALALLK